MIDIDCPLCGAKFEVDEWIGGNCPNCDNEYFWDEQYIGDHVNWSPVLLWERYS